MEKFTKRKTVKRKLNVTVQNSISSETNSKKRKIHANKRIPKPKAKKNVIPKENEKVVKKNKLKSKHTNDVNKGISLTSKKLGIKKKSIKDDSKTRNNNKKQKAHVFKKKDPDIDKSKIESDNMTEDSTLEDFRNKRNETYQGFQERNARTLFVGNVITSVKKTQLLKLFGKYGKIEAVRLRCATPVHPGVSKRLAVIRKLLHPKRATLHSYVTFVEQEDALKALELNGTKYKGHYLRVQICNDTTKRDTSKAIFLGNLPFDAEDNDLWEALEPFGAITSVRVVRNASTGMGIGIGFVNFQSSDSVELVLMNENIKIKNKEVRIQRYIESKSKNRKEINNKPTKLQSSSKKFNAKHAEFKKKGRNGKFKDKVSFTVKNAVFQGSKFNQRKKKPKLNKGIAQKIKLSRKIAPKAAK